MTAGATDLGPFDVTTPAGVHVVTIRRLTGDATALRRLGWSAYLGDDAIVYGAETALAAIAGARDKLRWVEAGV